MLETTVPRAVVDPPDGALLDRPFRFLTGQQQRCKATQRGLVADHQYGAARGGPFGRGDEVGNRRIGVEEA